MNVTFNDQHLSLRKKISESVMAKVAVIFLLILGLMIPKAMVDGLIREREGRQFDAVQSISSEWGGEQTVSGPILTVPFRTTWVDKAGKSHTSHLKYAHFLAKDLAINGEVETDTRSRGIYDVPVYKTELTMSGAFDRPDFSTLSSGRKIIYWESAFLGLGIRDLQGLNERVKVVFNGESSEAKPGVHTSSVPLSELVANTPLPHKNSKVSLPFSITISLLGSRDLSFLPLADESHVNITSGWPSPSFWGKPLPTERTVTDTGFTASWKRLSFNTDTPMSWEGSRSISERDAFGVAFMLPVNGYSQIERTSKYAILFIALTFVAFFLIEVMKKYRVHPIQYILVGFTLIVFYVLLLSFTEHYNFTGAYIGSSSAVIGLIGFYCKAILKSKSLTALVSFILSLLYSFLYVILLQEDYALLTGSIGLFVILAVVMYVTRNIDWYNMSDAVKGDAMQEAAPLSAV